MDKTFRFILSIHLFFFLAAPFIGNAQQSYFQQEVNYTIHVTLDDTKHELSATESIEYINNSPDELSLIYMHLWPNAYKNNSTALAKQLLENGKTKLYYGKEEDLGYIDQLDFKVNGTTVKWEYDPEHIDICKLILNEPLKSGNKITITTPFHVKLPKGGISRLGHIDQQYQITQWYPKPAVYDQNGWNQMPYLDQGEFYSEYGKFDVYITLPKNYVVGATGDLVDNQEELNWLDIKVNETKNREFVKKKTYTYPGIKSDSVLKTLHYFQNNVHDFAWFADKYYFVLKGEIELPHSKRKVTTWVMFNESQGSLWKNAVSYVNDAIYYYSLWNGDYPYNHATAVYGGLGAGGGMEYPNVTVIGNASSDIILETIIVHEVGHNWFYGILGSNERNYPWMDEGINSFNENRYFETKYPEAKLLGEMAYSPPGKWFALDHYKRKYQYYLGYLVSAKMNTDQPIQLPSPQYTEMNYGTIVYYKSAVVFDYLMAYLGEKKFDEAMKGYFETWKFKHPQPDDLKKVFEGTTGTDLAWFFDEVIKSTKKIDYKISTIKKLENGSYEFIVKNKTSLEVPVPIYAIKDNKVAGVVWYDGFKGKQELGFPPLQADYFKIDYPENIPEINRNNNRIRTKGLFKKTEPLKLQFLGSLDDPDKSQLFFTPVIGWNNYNRTMLGMAFYNNIFPPKKMEFVLMPMYAFGNKDLSGHGNLSFNLTPDNLFQSVQLSATLNRYAYASSPFALNFNKITPALNFQFKKRNARSPIVQSVNMRNVSIIRDAYSIVRENNIYVNSKMLNQINIQEISYRLKNTHKINPYDLMLTYQQGDDMSKLFFTANYEITLKGKKKSIDFRGFLGTFINDDNSGPYRYRLSGQTGYQDYLYDHVFLGRTEGDGFLSHQFTETDGAFKLLTYLGQTNKWIAALNIKSSLPGKIPVRIYADIGTFADDGTVKEKVLYDVGLEIFIIKDICEVYFPLLMSSDLKKNLELNNRNSFGERIRFTLNLNLLNPFQFIKNYSF